MLSQGNKEGSHPLPSSQEDWVRPDARGPWGWLEQWRETHALRGLPGPTPHAPVQDVLPYHRPCRTPSRTAHPRARPRSPRVPPLSKAPTTARCTSISVRPVGTLAYGCGAARQATKPFSTGALPCELWGEHREGASLQARPCPGIGAWVLDPCSAHRVQDALTARREGVPPKQGHLLRDGLGCQSPKWLEEGSDPHQEGNPVASPRRMGQKQPSLTLGSMQGRQRQVGKPAFPWRDPGDHPLLYLVALGSEGVVRVTGTRLTAPTAGQLPVVGSTLVTFGAHHMGQTQALPTLLITWHVPTRPQDAAVTACRTEGCSAHKPTKAHP